MKRLDYEWAFADVLHTPPHVLDRLTVDQFDRGCDYIDQVIAAQNKPADST